MSCICNKMNLTLNSHGSPNVAGADAALTALWFAHGLGNGISASSKCRAVTADGITCVGQRQFGEPGKVDMQKL